MDLVTTAIITALAAGITGGDAQAEDDPIIGAYEALKAVLSQKFGAQSDLAKAINSLEKKPVSPGWRTVLAEEITAVEADQTPEVVAAAQMLLNRLETPGGSRPRFQVAADHSPALPSLVPLQRPRRRELFIGRKAELARLLAGLEPGQVTILGGPEGIGKSALAAEAVWTLAPGAEPPDRFPDGLIYYNFYQRPQTTLALEQIARAFGEELWPTPQEAARRALAGRKALLILDRAEQADDLAGLLAVRNDCGVLLISSGNLAITAGRQDIPPLPFDEAVSLWQAWGLSPTADKTLVRQIYEGVGGLPLAMWLAGRYLARQPEAASHYLAWLTDTPLATLEPEQRRVESVPLLLEHSLARLSETAQQALAVVGLLAPAPFGAEIVAEALALRGSQGFWATLQRLFKPKSEEPETEEQIPEEHQALAELVDYGFLRPVEQRYEVSHLLIHAYIQRRLIAPMKTVEHLVAYYATLVGEQILWGLDGFATLDAEQPHLMRVLAACLEQANWRATYSLATAIEDYLDLRGYRTERVIANEAGLTAARKLGRRHNEGAWLGNLGLAYSDLGQVERAIEHYEQALEIAREIGDRRGEGNSLGKLGLAYRDLGQVKQARQYLARALLVFEDINSPSADMVRDWLIELQDE